MARECAAGPGNRLKLVWGTELDALFSCEWMVPDFYNRI